MLENDLEDAPGGQTRAAATVAGLTQLFPHMGHSRTPSACSAISFSSSILSEPISENYPHSEPETDSRGYEIVRDGAGGSAAAVAQLQQEMAPELDRGNGNDGDDELEDDEEEEQQKTQELNDAAEGVTGSDSHFAGEEEEEEVEGKMVIIESLNDIDDGHEADTEDELNCPMSPAVPCDSQTTTPTPLSPSSPVPVSHSGDDGGDSDSTETDSQAGLGKVSQSGDVDSQDGGDTVRELPHIDSIHSTSLDLSTEILSQHSCKTPDLSTDVLSTHSSKTLESPCTGQTTPGRNMASSSDLQDACAATAAAANQKLRTLDKERIESWVAETQKQIERLSVNGSLAVEVEVENIGENGSVATESASMNNANTDNHQDT